VFGSGDRAYDITGWLGGGQIGANAQSGRVVVGVEGEILWTGMNDNLRYLFGTQTFNLETRVRWISMVTGRIGFAPWDRWLVFVKGGAAFADERHDFFRDVPVSFTTVVSGSQLRSGFVIGAGVEHALLTGWSVKAEYNYIDFGQHNATLTGTNTFFPADTAATVTTLEIKQSIQLFKIGVNYHFHQRPAAVVARY
jgi:opacity protein-like surface antigen